MHLRHSFATNRKTFKDQKVSSDNAEGFFCRGLGLYVPRFPKNGAAAFTDLLELRLCLR